MTIPFTIDGQTTIEPDAPPAISTPPQIASDIQAASETYRANVLHLNADVADRTAILTASNCPEGELVFNFGDGSYEFATRVEMGDTPTVDHDYPSDGAFTATVRHSNGDRAQLEVGVNWPPPPPETEPPA